MTLDLSGMTLADSMRVSEMRLAWDAYNGRFPQPLHNRPRRTSDAVFLNRCASIVDKGVAFLFGKHVGFQVGETPDNPDLATRAQAYLDGCWKANRKMAFLQRLGTNGGVTGHVFAKILPGQPYARLVALDPTSISVEHAPDDIEDIRCYTIQYETRGDRDEPVLMRQRIERRADGSGWDITEQTRTGNLWQSEPPVAWDYPFSPIRQCQNLINPNVFWGKPDLTPDLIQLNKDINFVASNINRIIKYHAHPKTWVQGMNGNKLSVAPDETIILPEGATMGALEMHSDLSSSRAFMRDLMTGMEVSARIPSLALGDLENVPTGSISGIAIELLYGPAVEKTDTKRSLYGELLEDICRCLLALGGFDPNLEIRVIWADMLPKDALAAANVAAVYQGLGVSKESVMEAVGFSYRDEQARLVAEARDAQVLAALRALPAPSEPHQPALPGFSPDAAEQSDTAFESTLMAAQG